MTNNSNKDSAQSELKVRPIVILRWVAVLIWLGLIFFMSSNSSSSLDNDLGIFSQIYQTLQEVQANIFGPEADILSSIGHFLEYAVLSFLLVNALWQHMSLKKACLVAVLIASCYGALDEFHQYFTPERMSDPVDWIVDTLGAVFGALVGYPLIQKVDARRNAK